MNFSPEALAQIGQRNQRIKTVVSGQIPDRVPFVPTLGNVFCLEYGVTVKDSMLDATSLIPAVDQVMKDMDPDIFYAPACFPIKTMECLGAKYMGWPGSKPEFGDNAVYQVHDHTYLEDEEYEDFLKDPSGFLFKKVLAEKYASLQGLSMINPYTLCGQSVMGFAGLNIPPVKAALETLVKAADTTGEFINTCVALNMHILSQGYPIFGEVVAQNPFDEFAGNVRGLVNTVMDLKIDPDLLKEAVNRFAEATIPSAVAMAKMQHATYAFVPLHAGVDEFMSPDDYYNYYWPTLKQLLDAFIAIDVTPIVVCEGNYKTRLDVLKEITPGKVIFFFEKQDMKLAKEKLGSIACIGGNLSTNTLIYGTKEQVVEETKALLDVLAPGGGYIMTNDICIDQCKRENLIAWHDATMDFGKY